MVCKAQSPGEACEDAQSQPAVLPGKIRDDEAADHPSLAGRGLAERGKRTGDPILPHRAVNGRGVAEGEAVELHDPAERYTAGLGFCR